MILERRSGVAAIIALLVVPAVIPIFLELKDPFSGANFGVRRFNSSEELTNYIMTRQGEAFGPYALWDSFAARTLSIKGTAPVTAAVNAVGDQFSTTNVQVEGIDEADVVKTDGAYLYIISGSKIVLLNAYPPQNMSLVSEIPLEGQSIGMFVHGDRMVILEQFYPQVPIIAEDGTSDAMPWMANASIKIYDISDRHEPSLLNQFSVNGFYSDSRMVGNYLYVVVGEPAVIYNERVILPKIYYPNGVVEIQASDIYYYNSTADSQTMTTLFAIDVQGNAEPNRLTFLTGFSDVVYMSEQNIYITQTVWEDRVVPMGQGQTPLKILPLQGGQEMTVIHKIGVDGLDLVYVAKGEVPGHVLNQFAMDEFAGNFRIATTAYEDLLIDVRLKEVNNLYVLDSDMKVVGSLEDLAPGESMHSARFMGDTCYMVTFKKVDPLFVIDLTSPTEPKVIGKLKIPGYSDYLHPFEDGFLIGIGKETVEAEEGDFAWYQGLKVSLFDVRALDSPKEVSKLVIGNRGTDSPVLYDHKAFLLDKDRGLIVMPVLVAEIDSTKYPDGVPSNAYGEFTWQGAYVIKVSSEGGLTVLGRITHLEDADDIDKSGFYFESARSIKRALYIHDTLYTISDDLVKANDIYTLQEIKIVELNA